MDSMASSKDFWVQNKIKKNAKEQVSIAAQKINVGNLKNYFPEEKNRN